MFNPVGWFGGKVLGIGPMYPVLLTAISSKSTAMHRPLLGVACLEPIWIQAHPAYPGIVSKSTFLFEKIPAEETIDTMLKHDSNFSSTFSVNGIRTQEDCVGVSSRTNYL
jgi:hypothetical protein